MAEYINRDAYIKYLSSRKEEFIDDFGQGWCAGIDTAISACEKFPAADVEPVRCGKMTIERRWAMPNKWTFCITPIKELVEEAMNIGELWIDPFAGMHSPATVTNDLNPEMPSDYHMDALEFLKTFSDESVDGILYDPPYSPRQVRECYDGISGGIKWDGKTNFWSDTKNECARILKPQGKIICFGWNSMGLGKNRGFTMEKILLVPHGGSRNDTICTVERKDEVSE